MADNKAVAAIKILAAILLFTPLLTGGSIAFFNLRQLVFFRTIVEILFVLYLYLIFTNSSYRPRGSLLLLAVLISGSVYFVSTLFSSNFHMSLWGSEQRFGGFINIAHILIFAIILSSVLKREDFYRLFRLSAFVALVVSIYSIFQLLGFTGLKGHRIVGTLGNAGLLAGYLLPNLFFVIYFLLNGAKQNKTRVFYSITALILSIVIYLTGVRGALLAMFIGHAFILASILPTKLKRTAIRIAAAGIVLILLFYLSGAYKSRIAERTIPGPFLNLETLSYRSQTWNIAIEGWKDKPFGGWGPENFGIIYSKYFDSLEGPENFWDKSHNIFLESLTTQGIFGLVALMFFIVVIAASIKRNLRPDKEYAIFGAVAASYFTHNFFFFDSLPSSLIFFLVIAFILSAYDKPPLSENKKNVPIRGKIIVSVVLLLAILIIYKTNIRPLIADNYYSKGLALYAERPNESIEFFKRSLDLNTPEQLKIRRDLASLVNTKSDFHEISGIRPSEKEFDFAINEIEKSFIDERSNIFNYLYASSLYINYGRTYGDRAYFQKAEDLLNKTIGLSPARKQTYHLLSEAKLGNKKENEAREILLKMVALNPNSPETFWKLALLEKNLNNSKKALEYAEKAESLLYSGTRNNIPDIVRLVEIYADTNTYFSMLEANARLIRLRPSYVRPYVSTAAIYKEIGDTESAIIYANKAVELDPSLNDQLQIFLKTLE